jgi:periplasmic divalent cation tolerance protein
MTDKILVLTTCDSEKQAEKLARHLVDRRVAACVNVLPKARSIYRWKEKVEEAAEWLLIIKSRRDLFDALRAEVQKLHTYEIPELIALPVVDGSEAYLAWFDAQLTAKAE